MARLAGCVSSDGPAHIDRGTAAGTDGDAADGDAAGVRWSGGRTTHEKEWEKRRAADSIFVYGLSRFTRCGVYCKVVFRAALRIV